MECFVHSKILEQKIVFEIKRQVYLQENHCQLNCYWLSSLIIASDVAICNRVEWTLIKIFQTVVTFVASQLIGLRFCHLAKRGNCRTDNCFVHFWVVSSEVLQDFIGFWVTQRQNYCLLSVSILLLIYDDKSFNTVSTILCCILITKLLCHFVVYLGTRLFSLSCHFFVGRHFTYWPSLLPRSQR